MPLTDVTVKLIGEDGNAFFIIGRVASKLRSAGYVDEAERFTSQAFAADSYDRVLQLVMQYVNVT